MPKLLIYNVEQVKSKIVVDKQYSLRELNEIFPHFIIPEGASLRLDYARWKIKEMDTKIVFVDKLPKNHISSFSSDANTIYIAINHPTLKKKEINFTHSILHEIFHASIFYDLYFTKYPDEESRMHASIINAKEMGSSNFIKMKLSLEKQTQFNVYEVINEYKLYLHRNDLIDADKEATNWLKNKKLDKKYFKHYSLQYAECKEAYEKLMAHYQTTLTESGISLKELRNRWKVKKPFWRSYWDNFSSGIEPGFLKDKFFSFLSKMGENKKPLDTGFIKKNKSTDINMKLFEEFIKKKKMERDEEHKKFTMSIWPPKNRFKPLPLIPISRRREQQGGKFIIRGTKAERVKPWWENPFHPKISSPQPGGDSSLYKLIKFHVGIDGPIQIIRNGKIRYENQVWDEYGIVKINKNHN